MNRPCTIHFHPDAAPAISSLPERYRANITREADSEGIALAVSVQNAFLVDFCPEIIRTRVKGEKKEDPVDFPLASICFIEWFYGNSVPEPLKPEPFTPRNH